MRPACLRTAGVADLEELVRCRPADRRRRRCRPARGGREARRSRPPEPAEALTVALDGEDSFCPRPVVAAEHEATAEAATVPAVEVLHDLVVELVHRRCARSSTRRRTPSSAPGPRRSGAAVEAELDVESFCPRSGLPYDAFAPMLHPTSDRMAALSFAGFAGEALRVEHLEHARGVKSRVARIDGLLLRRVVADEGITAILKERPAAALHRPS